MILGLVIMLPSCTPAMFIQNILGFGEAANDAAQNYFFEVMNKRQEFRVERYKIDLKIIEIYKDSARELEKKGELDDAVKELKKAKAYLKDNKPTFTELVKDWKAFKVELNK